MQPPPPPAPAHSIELGAEEDEVGAGAQVQLYFTARNWPGWAPPGTPSAAYSTSDSSIATVSTKGLVTALAPGKAVLSVTVSYAGLTATDTFAITVFTPTILTGVVITETQNGWQPTPVHVANGTPVEWHGGPITAPGNLAGWLWVMEMDYTVIDSLDLRAGPAKRTFQKSGSFRYCSGICWDPPEWGVIHIH